MVQKSPCTRCSILVSSSCEPTSLQKEERAHDARLATANGKIKQAGQIYERKVKKNPTNAADEHARYIAVLGAVGPEVAQEK